MYLMPMRNMLAMEKMTTHQELLRQGKLGEYTSDLEGRPVFISHQWLGHKHPDPNNEQLTVLQRVVTRLMQRQISSVEPHWMQAFEFGGVGVSAAQWKAALPHMHFWLDYAGIPGITVREAND